MLAYIGQLGNLAIEESIAQFNCQFTRLPSYPIPTSD